jgi:AraC-like DNA-binding protein
VLDEFQIIYLIAGEGVFESRETGPVALRAGSVVLIFPGVWHRYRPLEGSKWHTYWVGFGGSHAHLVMGRLHLSPEEPVQKIGYRKRIIQIFQQIFELGAAEFPGCQQVMSGEVIKLIGWLKALKRKADFGDDDTDAMIQKAKVIIMNSPDDMPVERVADELNLGYSKFRKLFKEYTGIAPGQYRIELKLKRAIEGLYDMEKPVKEIAMESGFSSPYYFSRLFKKKLGCSPVAYRKRLFAGAKQDDEV